MANEQVFPPEWPADCPPSDATEADGVVFRASKNNPPLESDFETWAQIGRKVKGATKQCQACAISVYRTMEDVRHSIGAFPSQGKHVAKAILDPSCGVVK